MTPHPAFLIHGYVAVRAGGAGPAVDRRGQLPHRVREEAGEGTRHQSPSSRSPVQEVNLDWCQENPTEDDKQIFWYKVPSLFLWKRNL